MTSPAAQLYAVMLMPSGGINVVDLRDVIVVSSVIAALLGTHWFMREQRVWLGYETATLARYRIHTRRDVNRDPAVSRGGT